VLDSIRAGDWLGAAFLLSVVLTSALNLTSPDGSGWDMVRLVVAALMAMLGIACLVRWSRRRQPSA
jgi:hypothetical protein